MHQGRSTMAAVLDGAIAGAVATWGMGKATSYLYAREDRAAREREDRARHGSTSYAVAAQKAARLAGTELSEEKQKEYGKKLHWAIGVGAGAAYGALRSRVPAVAAVRGLAFGTAFFLLMDEGLVYALGLTPGPGRFPWQTHARGLAGHLAFGAIADRTLSVLEGRT